MQTRNVLLAIYCIVAGIGFVLLKPIEEGQSTRYYLGFSITRECQRKQNITFAEMASYMQGMYTEHDKRAKCALYCRLHQEGVFLNGAFNWDNCKAMINNNEFYKKPVKVIMTNMFEKCRHFRQDPDPCESAFNLLECVSSEWQNSVYRK